jgi:hypothetical protein
MSDQFETLLRDAEQSINELAGESENGDPKPLLQEISTLLKIVDEAEDLLETIDLSELPEAIDGEELLTAIDAGEIPAALKDGDSDKVVKLRQLVHAVKLVKLWSAVDIQEFWQEKSELDEVVGELTDGEDDGIIGEALDATMDAVSGQGEESIGDEVDAIESELKAGAKESFGSAEDALKDGNLHEYQLIIQQQTMAGIKEFRDALIDTHGVFEQLYDENRKKFRRTNKGTHSRNPTAVSTMPLTRTDLGKGTRYSTVPPAVRYSTAPPLDRIYGQRFKQKKEERQREEVEQNSD